MRILYVIHDFLPRHQAGAEIYTHLLAREMSQAHETLIFFTEIATLGNSYSIKKRTVDGLSCIEVFRPPEADLSSAPYLDAKMEEIFSHILTEFRPDVIHLQHLLYHSLRYPEIARRHGIPILLTLHDYWLTCPRWGQRLQKNLEICFTIEPQKCAPCIFAPPEKSKRLSFAVILKFLRRGHNPAKTVQEQIAAVLKRADQVHLATEDIDLFIAPSPFLRTMFIAFGIPENKILLSDNGTDTRGYSRKERNQSPRIRFGFIGTINEHKGVHILIEAFNRIPASKAELHIYGDMTWFPEYSARLTELVASPAISFKGAIAHSSVPQVLAEIDVLVVPSIWLENSPLTIHEAFLAGVPVIASNIGGMADLITNRGNGLLFKANDCHDLAAAMLEIVDSESLLAKLCRGIPTVKSMQENGVEMEQIYTELVHRRQPYTPPDIS